MRRSRLGRMRTRFVNRWHEEALKVPMDMATLVIAASAATSLSLVVLLIVVAIALVGLIAFTV